MCARARWLFLFLGVRACDVYATIELLYNNIVFYCTGRSFKDAKQARYLRGK